MAEIKNLERLVARLRAKAAETIKDAEVEVTVGYTQSYALHVHENLESWHKPGKQAKFLEQPFRELSSEFVGIVFDAIRAGKTFATGLLLAGLRLQRESQKLVPVDTGALRASAFTKIERS